MNITNRLRIPDAGVLTESPGQTNLTWFFDQDAHVGAIATAAGDGNGAGGVEHVVAFVEAEGNRKAVEVHVSAKQARDLAEALVAAAEKSELRWLAGHR